MLVFNIVMVVKDVVWVSDIDASRLVCVILLVAGLAGAESL